MSGLLLLVVAGAAAAVVAYEVTGIGNKAAKRLVRQAAKRFPEGPERERWEEEWLADLERISRSNVLRFLFAFRVTGTARRMASRAEVSDATETVARKKETKDRRYAYRMIVRGRSLRGRSQVSVVYKRDRHSLMENLSVVRPAFKMLSFQKDRRGEAERKDGSSRE